MEDISDELERQVIAALESHTPWNVIAETFHLSTKTIDKINKKRLGQQYSKAEGTVSSKAFEMFESGKSPIEVVILLEQNPEVINKLHQQFLEMNYDKVLTVWDERSGRYKPIIKTCILTECPVCGGDHPIEVVGEALRGLKEWVYANLDARHPACRRRFPSEGPEYRDINLDLM